MVHWVNKNVFDSVKWDYMYGVLAKFNFGEDLIKWIEHVI